MRKGINFLKGLPPVKMHCSNLAADALHAAIDNYKEKIGEKEKTKDKNICHSCE